MDEKPPHRPYTTIEAESRVGLEIEVNRKLMEGAELVGGVCVHVEKDERGFPRAIYTQAIRIEL